MPDYFAASPCDGVMKGIQKTLRYCKPHWLVLIVAIGVGLCALLCQIVMPLITRVLIDDVLSGLAPQWLFAAASSLVGAALGMVLFTSLKSYLFARLAGQVATDIRNQIAEHMRRIPMDYAHEKHSGEIMSMFVSDVPAFCKVFEFVIGPFVLNILRLAITFSVLIFVSRRLAFLALFAVPAYILIPAFSGRRLREASRRLQEQQAALTVDLQESISATREIRAFNRQEWDKNRLQEAFVGVFRADLRQTLLRAASTSTYVLYWLVVGAIYVVGGRRVLSGQMTLGSLIAAVAYFASLEDPVRSLVGLNQQLQASLGAATRIFQFLGQPGETLDRETAKPLRHCLGKVQFEAVHFAYQNSHPVLCDISFTVYPGQRVALVGASGSGKTSIILLLLRLFEPTRGRILIDDRDIKDFTVDSLRDMIGAVFQDSFLFAASVRDNIRFGNLTAADDALTEAATAAYIHDFIVQLPKSYDTTVGERGVKLSGGQKQRIAVARALVRKPQILIMDEATSALDAESESTVYHAILAGSPDRTTFIVAHRLSTILAADTILVLSEGRIIGAGTHEQLMARCSLYHKMYKLQAMEEERHLPTIGEVSAGRG